MITAVFIIFILALHEVTSLFQRSSTIFAGSCINISVPHLHGVAIEKYYIQTLETFYVLYENDREKYTNVGLEYAARKTWVILCGGNLFHAAVLKVDYSKSSEKFTHSNTLVFTDNIYLKRPTINPSYLQADLLFWPNSKFEVSGSHYTHLVANLREIHVCQSDEAKKCFTHQFSKKDTGISSELLEVTKSAQGYQIHYKGTNQNKLIYLVWYHQTQDELIKTRLTLSRNTNFITSCDSHSITFDPRTLSETKIEIVFDNSFKIEKEVNADFVLKTRTTDKRIDDVNIQKTLNTITFKDHDFNTAVVRIYEENMPMVSRILDLKQGKVRTLTDFYTVGNDYRYDNSMEFLKPNMFTYFHEFKELKLQLAKCFGYCLVVVIALALGWVLKRTSKKVLPSKDSSKNKRRGYVPLNVIYG